MSSFAASSMVVQHLTSSHGGVIGFTVPTDTIINSSLREAEKPAGVTDMSTGTISWWRSGVSVSDHRSWQLPAWSMLWNCCWDSFIFTLCSRAAWIYTCVLQGCIFNFFFFWVFEPQLWGSNFHIRCIYSCWYHMASDINGTKQEDQAQHLDSLNLESPPSFSFDLRGAVRRQLCLDGGDFFPHYFQGALSMCRARRAFLCWALLRAVAFVWLKEGFPALGFDVLHAQFGRHHSATWLVGFPDTLGEGGDATLLEVLVHEGVHDGVVEAVEEPDGLNYGNDHVERDAVIFVLQVIWRTETIIMKGLNHTETLKLINSANTYSTQTAYGLCGMVPNRRWRAEQWWSSF